MGAMNVRRRAVARIEQGVLSLKNAREGVRKKMMYGGFSQ